MGWKITKTNPKQIKNRTVNGYESNLSTAATLILVKRKNKKTTLKGGLLFYIIESINKIRRMLPSGFLQ